LHVFRRQKASRIEPATEGRHPGKKAATEKNWPPGGGQRITGLAKLTSSQ
jgi:hypothetical protein